MARDVEIKFTADTSELDAALDRIEQRLTRLAALSDRAPVPSFVVHVSPASRDFERWLKKMHEFFKAWT